MSLTSISRRPGEVARRARDDAHAEAGETLDRIIGRDRGDHAADMVVRTAR